MKYGPKHKLKIQLAFLLSVMMLISTACAKEEGIEGSDVSPDNQVEAGTPEDMEEMSSDDSDKNISEVESMTVEYSAKDLNANFDRTAAVQIVFSGESVSTTGEEISVKGTEVLISTAGTYILSGSSTDGQVVVDAPEDADVILVLDGLNLANPSISPIRVMEADKVIITLVEGTENTLTDGSEYNLDPVDEDEPDATIYSKADLTINGTGSLTVYGNHNHGIVSKDDLKIISGQISIYSINDGLKGKDLVAVRDGKITIEAGGDGIQSDQDEDPEKGRVIIENGTLDIIAALDGIQAETVLSVKNGVINIKSGGGSENSSQEGAWGNWGGKDEIEAEVESESQTSDSAKGLKAGRVLHISDGIITIDSSDDSIHSNRDITISGGDIEISSGDDAVHADQSLLIEDGDIYIITSYEGLEAASIIIKDGKIHIGAMDDGINTSGGNDGSSVNGRPGQNQFDMSDGSNLLISGGQVFIDAEGDGIDSNGDIEMTGGFVVIHGPINGADSAVDYNGSYVLTSGTLLAIGSSGMAKNITETSTQGSFLLNTTEIKSGTTVHIETAEGEEIITFSSDKNYNSILLSSSLIEKGEDIRVLTGGEAEGVDEYGIYAKGSYSGGTLLVDIEMTSLQTTIGESSEQMGPGKSPGSGMEMGPGMKPEVDPDMVIPGKRP